MPEIFSISELSQATREEYTSTALKRSTNIDGSAPDGYMKIIQSIVLATKKKNGMVSIAEVKSEYDKSNKSAKEISGNIGKLTAQPFPIVYSEKLIDPDVSNKVRNVPLYDEATGNTVADRYATVKLSPLGELLTRHYKNKSLDEVNYYNSIVPMSLLRKSMPWSMGHKGEFQPLNPSELFRIIDKMLELNSPFVPEDFLIKTFKGVDLGEDYSVYTNTESLINLYTIGESSITVIPRIEIQRKEKKIIFHRPPLDSTTKKLASYLRQKAITQDGSEFKTFTPDIKVNTIGRKAHLVIDKFNGTDAQILTELMKDSYITKKLFIKNHNIIFTKNEKERSTLVEDQFLTGKSRFITGTTLSKLVGNIPKDELKKFSKKDFEDLITKYNAFDVKESELTEKDVKYEIQNRFKANRNPYNFEIDLMPVYEILWRCILGERELQLIEIKKKIEELKEQLKYDLLLEKVTRPEVAQRVYELQPDNNRIKKLLEETQPGSKLLPEGFELWEAEEIYRERKNNILANIFKRDKYKDLYIATKGKLDNWIKILEDPQYINNEIRKDIVPFIKGADYQRKSKVFFVPEYIDESQIKSKVIDTRKPMAVEPNWDNLDLPTTIYYNDVKFRRGYGVNIYFSDFIPSFELNTTNNEKVELIISNMNSGEIERKVIQVKDIPKDNTVNVSDFNNDRRLLGIIPYGKPTENFILWTSKGNYMIYAGSPNENFKPDLDEYIWGWEYYDKQFLDIRSVEGFQTIDKTELKKFLVGLKPLPYTTRIAYDMLNKSKPDNVVRLRNTVTSKDNKSFRRVLWKTKYAKALELSEEAFAKIFSEHSLLYHGGTYLPSWQRYQLSGRERFLPPKRVYLSEYADILEDKTEISSDIARKVRKKINNKVEENEYISEADKFANTLFNTIGRFTKSYLNFRVTDFKEFMGIFDPRRIKIQEEIDRKFSDNTEYYDSQLEYNIEEAFSDADESDDAEEVTE